MFHRLSSLAALAAVPFLFLADLSAQDWTLLKPTTSPTGRNAHSIAADLSRNVVVLFSGSNDQADTWEFNGTTWTQKKPAKSPPALRHHVLVYDRSRKKIVLFGGRAGGARKNETWEWDGTNWTQITTKNVPDTRYGLCGDYDAARGKVVIFAGLGCAQYCADVWEYDGKDWTKSTATGPKGRIYPQMVYDFTRRVMVLFAGYSLGDLADTWEYDGKKWTEIKTPTVPGARWGHVMTYVLGKGIVMYGGFKSVGGSKAYDDTWVYDGKDWMELKPKTKPPTRRLAWMTTNLLLRGIMFGGSAGATDTWEWNFGAFAPASYAPFGTACKGTAGVPTLAGSKPWMNENFTIDVTNVQATANMFLMVSATNTAYQGNTLPFDISFMGYTGCKLYCGWEILVSLKATGGKASLTLPLPNAASLVGTKFFNQAFVADTGVPAGAITTNGVAGQVGRR